MKIVATKQGSGKGAPQGGNQEPRPQQHKRRLHRVAQRTLYQANDTMI